jgi:hypothetical protein
LNGVNPNEFIKDNGKGNKLQANTQYTQEEQQIIDKAKADGTYMKAPNGKPTKLNEKQWVQVRTKAFKEWFGDWELGAKVVKIIKGIKEHGFTNFAQARQWAKENIVGTFSNKEIGEINISNTAILKYLTKSAIEKSIDKDIHLSVLKVLPRVIEESIDAEQHPDYKKGTDGNRSIENGINNDVMIHRLFGAVEIGGKTYRVKTTIKENVKTKENKKAYSYEVTEIELLDGQHKDVTMTSFRNSNNSIEGAKLLQDVESSKEKGKKLLDYSKVVDENGEPSIVYHGTRQFGFNIFDPEYSDDSMSIFSTKDVCVAKSYAGVQGEVRKLNEEKETKSPIKAIEDSFSDYDISTEWGFADALEIVSTDLDIDVTLSEDEKEITVKSNFNSEEYTWRKSDGYDAMYKWLAENTDTWWLEDADAENGIYALYENLKNPLIVDCEDNLWFQIPPTNVKGITTESKHLTTREVSKFAKEQGYDGVIFRNIIDQGGAGKGLVGDMVTDVFVSFNGGSAFKSATDNIGTFDKNNKDIRFHKVQDKSEIERVNTKFNSKLKEFDRDEMKSNEQFDLGMPSEILIASGIPTARITMTQSVLKKHLVKHSLKTEDIKDLVRAIQNPIMIYEWGTKAKNSVIITAIQRGNQRITISIRLDKDEKGLKVNGISSIHGKSIERLIQEFNTTNSDFVKDNLKYINKEQVLNWFAMETPLASSQTNQGLISVAKVLKDFQNLQIKSEKNTNRNVKSLGDSEIRNKENNNEQRREHFKELEKQAIALEEEVADELHTAQHNVVDRLIKNINIEVVSLSGEELLKQTSL